MKGLNSSSYGRMMSPWPISGYIQGVAPDPGSPRRSPYLHSARDALEERTQNRSLGSLPIHAAQVDGISTLQRVGAQGCANRVGPVPTKARQPCVLPRPLISPLLGFAGKVVSKPFGSGTLATAQAPSSRA